MMFYTACKPEDLGTDSIKILHPTEEAARSEDTGSVLALDVRYGERPDRFYSNRTDANGHPEWSVEPRRISDERWLILGPVPRWLVVPADRGEPTQVAVARPSKINRRILQAVSDLQGDDEARLINDTQVADRTGIDLKIVRDQMVLLADRGMIVDADDSAGHAAGLTARGRICAEEGE